MIIPTNYAQANIKFSGVGLPSNAEITLGLNKELWAGTAAAAAQEVRVAFQVPAIRALISSSLNIEGVLVKFGPNATGQSGESTSVLAGTAAASATSPNVALLVRKNTGFGGRTGRGRFYIPGLIEVNVDPAGAVWPAHVTAANAALETFRTTLVGLGLVPTLLHGALSPVSTPMPITSFSVDATAATQRRRLRR